MTTTKIPTRMAVRGNMFLTVLVGAAVAAGILFGPTTSAHALPPVGEGAAATCTWGNEQFSQGARINRDGRKWECTADGTWRDVGPASARRPRVKTLGANDVLPVPRHK